MGKSTKQEELKVGCLLARAKTNPILSPRAENSWESNYVFNGAALLLNNKVHLCYRAIGNLGQSVLGYASSNDGFKIEERSSKPIYMCNEAQEAGKPRPFYFNYSSGGSFNGCEDPRLVIIDTKIYMTYTSFSGSNTPPRVALTSISESDFLNQYWYWQKPVLLSSPNATHKNWVIFPEKINNKFAILHSISPKLLIDYFDTLDFIDQEYINSYYNESGRDEHWDSCVRGIGPPPIKTKDGWLILYHAMDKKDPNKYKLGAMILDLDNPSKILYRSSRPLLEPNASYENDGFKRGVIYCCGAVVKDKNLLVYYGGADKVLCLAYASLNELLVQIKN